jgi:hypothetical protein
MLEAEEIEKTYTVPSHLATGETIGPLPGRLFYSALIAIVFAPLLGLVGYTEWRWPGAIILAALVVLVVLPFSLWWLRPPFEHGALAWLGYRFRPRLLGPDQLRNLARMRVENGLLWTGYRQECRAVWKLATVNLDVASVALKRSHMQQWGALLDGLGFPLQVVILAEPLRALDVVHDIREAGTDEAKVLAAYLGEQIGKRSLVSRTRYLVVGAETDEALQDRIVAVERAFAQHALEVERIDSDRDIEALVNRVWTPHPVRGRLGPAIVQENARDLVTDGVFCRVFSLGELPPTIVVDWWRAMLDGDLPADVSIDIEPKATTGMTGVLFRLDSRWNQLSSSSASPARDVAMRQIRGLRMALEERRVLPYGLSVTLAVRGVTRDELEKRAAHLVQLAADKGAKLRVLRWEQLAAMERIAPVHASSLPRRQHLLESGTLARSTPLSSATLQVPNGVPWGEAGNAPVLFTTFGGQLSSHMCWYGTSGAGKGFGLRVLLSREHFQKDLRIFVVDSDEQGEYSGRFCTYLHGRRIPVRSLDDLHASLLGRDDQVVVFDLSGCPDNVWGDCFARIKQLVQDHVQQYPGPTAFVVDEATMVLGDVAASFALGDAIRTWRHFNIAVHVLTQRVSDWATSDLGRQIQGVVGTWWCGKQSPMEIDDVARELRLSPAERSKIEKAGRGMGLLVTLDKRIWLDLFQKASPEEYAMAHTDPPGLVRRRRLRQRSNGTIEAGELVGVH